MYYSRDRQVLFSTKKDFKTESHSTIHIFKNYFTTVFSVFNNKRYPNKPMIFNVKGAFGLGRDYWPQKLSI